VDDEGVADPEHDGLVQQVLHVVRVVHERHVHGVGVLGDEA